MHTSPNEAEPSSGGLRATEARGFGSASLWTVVGTVIPGVGLLRAGRRLAGGIVLGIVAVGVIGLGIFGLINRDRVAQYALDPGVLRGLAAALVAIAVLWVVVIATTHLALRSSPASPAQRLMGAALVGVLSFAVSAPLALLANYAYTTGTAISTIFDGNDGDTSTPAPADTDPWATTDRLNILILGGDSGVKSNRSKAVGARTDTIIVASIDTHTGATTLITVPRNAEKMPFPPGSPLLDYYPNGFSAPAGADLYTRSQYLANAMYRDIPAQVPNNILGKTKDFGASVLMQSVGYAVGLDIDYYVLVNMDGFKAFINAIGGITVNVNYAVPIGGHNASPPEPEEKPAGWIEPGPNQHLTGSRALWYARGRYHLDDYSRMERQRCLVYAVAQQTTPTAVLTNYESILKTGENNISTNIPRTMLPALAQLGMTVKNAKIRSLVLDPSTGFLSYKPDWNWVRSKVRKALNETKAAVNSPSPSATASGSASPSPNTKPAKSDELAAACSYHPDDYTPTKR
ncbi:MAG: LCP family protein [Micropruina sp.]|uniref:LCP family protein n=1 Tax=Micropruina sp. TaxID=2737536 RepID=UPI0039E5A9D9